MNDNHDGAAKKAAQEPKFPYAPWSSDTDGEMEYVVGVDGIPLVRVERSNDSRIGAFVAAAPDLFAALAELVAAEKALDAASEKAIEEAIRRIDAALAKARGEVQP